VEVFDDKCEPQVVLLPAVEPKKSQYVRLPIAREPNFETINEEVHFFSLIFIQFDQVEVSDDVKSDPHLMQQINPTSVNDEQQVEHLQEVEPVQPVEEMEHSLLDDIEDACLEMRFVSSR